MALDTPADGTYQATVTHAGGVRGISYALGWNITHMPADEMQVWPSLSPGESHEFVWMAKSPNPPKEPDAQVTLDALILSPQGAGYEAHYIAGAGRSERVAGGEEATPLLTSGEFRGFSALGLLGLSVASGALRTRGGRARSQDRSRQEVNLHRLAWLAVVSVLLLHGAVQIAAGHLDDTATVLVGTAAFGALASLVWFNAYRRPRVLAMAWPKWLRMKLAWVGLVLGLVAVHVLVLGRHFAG